MSRPGQLNLVQLYFQHLQLQFLHFAITYRNHGREQGRSSITLG
jgi:hypothetical protein